jgi:hypothetical protein
MSNLAELSSAADAVGIPAKLVTLSRNETESLCMKAARGAGFSWGLAEEAGFAAGWLAAQGIDGTAPLLALLTEKLAQPAESGRPRPTPAHWRCMGDGPLCPITTGAALVDSALLIDGPFTCETRLDPVGTPLLLLPFLARAAQICGKSLMIDGQNGDVLITGNGVFDRSAAASWIGQGSMTMTIRTGPGAQSLQVEQARLPAISLAILNGLDALALRTTVPATDASRRGAGSATTDND